MDQFRDPVGWRVQTRRTRMSGLPVAARHVRAPILISARARSHSVAKPKINAGGGCRTATSRSFGVWPQPGPGIRPVGGFALDRAIDPMRTSSARIAL